MPNIKGGGARPVLKVTSGQIKASPARAVYGFPSQSAAVAAGFRDISGPALPVNVVPISMLRSNGGPYIVEGENEPIAVFPAAADDAAAGDAAQPVFLVGGSL